MLSQPWKLKSFHQLSATELYSILRLRNAVFILEQQCLFEEIDGNDIEDCYHLFYSLDTGIQAYARIIAPNVIFKEPCISRVCTSPDQRSKGLGKELMRRALTTTEELFPMTPIKIAAQHYLVNFYEEFGFNSEGKPYLEDGIQHVLMSRSSGVQLL